MRDGLITTPNLEFKRKLVPAVNQHNAVIRVHEECKEDDWGLETPKPDRYLGDDPARFDHLKPPNLLISSQIHDLLNIVPLMIHPVAILESKGAGGNSLKPRIQARRGSAVLVRNARALRKKADLDTSTQYSDVDCKTFVFVFPRFSRTIHSRCCMGGGERG